MKKCIQFLTLLFAICYSSTLFGQISIVESMDGGVPATWTSSGYVQTTSTPCEGSASVRDNLYSFSTTGFVETPNTTASNGTDISVSYDWQATDFLGDPVDFTVNVEYSLDQGGTYTSIGMYAATSVTPCTQFSTTIAGASVPVGSDFQLRITADWVSGDNYHWIDNVSITQVAMNPPNCDAALTSSTTEFPLAGSLAWSAASGAPTFYSLQVGSSPGGSDIVNEANIGLVTSYDMSAAGLAFGTTYYATIIPSNANGPATGCTPEAFTTEADPNMMFTVDCGTATNTTHCYSDFDATTFLYTASDGTSALKMTFNDGGIESCCDDIIVYDGTDATGTVLYSGNNGGDLSGLEISSTGPNIFMVIDADGSVDCDQGSGCCTSSWDWDVECLSCAPGAGSASVGSCDPANGFMIDVDVTDLGDGSIVIKNDGGVSDVTVTTTGVTMVGPFAFSTDVVITLGHATDMVCDVTLPTISIPSGCPPANDECDGAFSLTVNTDLNCAATTAGTIANSTGSGVSDASCGGTEDDDVWFSFVAAATSHTIDLLNPANGTTDLYHSVWEGSCGNLTLTAGSCSDPNSSTVAGLTIGNTYYLRVYSWTATAGQMTTFDVCIGTLPPPPAEDVCTGAIDIPVVPGACSGLTTGNNSGATDSDNDPATPAATCTSYGGGDIWFKLTVPASGNVTISGGPSPGCCSFLWYEVYEGATCGSLTSIMCSATTGNDPSAFEMELTGRTAGEELFIRAWDSSNDDGPGDFNFCAYEPLCSPPAADNFLISFLDCPTSTTILFDVTDMGDANSLTVTNDAGGVNPANITAIGTEFEVTGLPTSGTVTITLGHDVDPSCNIDLGPFTLSCPPVNDDVANAIDISLDTPCSGDAYSNAFSSAEAGEVDGTCFALTTTVNSVWFTFTAPSSGAVNISNDILGDGTGDLTDGQLAVFSVTDPTDFSTFSQVACSEDDGSVVGFGYMNDIDVSDLTGGATYYVLVDGYGSAVGDFCLEISTLCEAATRVALPTATTTALPADACTDSADGFTYYDDGAGNYIFAVNWDPSGTGANAAAKAAAEVEIRKYTANGTQAGVWEPFDNSATEASFAMLTSWNVDLNGSAMTGPVDVKFYYDAAEKASVEAASAAHATTNSVPDNGGMWFKNENADYVHTGQVTAADFSSSMTILTDVAAGGTDNGVPYARFDGVTSFSGGTFATGAGAGFLPIEIADFRAKAMDYGNKVMWATASEVNNDYQMIQKSQDGLNGWSEVGRVKSDGNSRELRTYDVMDMDPYATSYYRIYSVDLDGRTQVSNVISVERRLSNSMTIYPNPARDRATVVVESVTDGIATMSVVDITGKLVSRISQTLVAGQNEVILDLSDLQQGVYSVIYSSANESKVQRLVVE